MSSRNRNNLPNNLAQPLPSHHHHHHHHHHHPTTDRSVVCKGSMIKRVPAEETIRAANNITGYAIRTPLVPLAYRRPDRPDLEIYLKLETLQPINSFKVRGAVHKIRSIVRHHRQSQRCHSESSGDDNVDNDDDDAELSRILHSSYGNTIVTASAGNMGQGVAYAATSLNCSCVVIVPDHAPATKLAAMERKYGARVIKVPFSRWWEIISTSDVREEMGGGESEGEGGGGGKYLFVHPVCDPDVVAGNSTIGLEILRDLPDVDAVFCPWGGGGCSSGIGSVLKNVSEFGYGCYPGLAPPPSSASPANNNDNNENDKGPKRTINMMSVEPSTASPLCYSFHHSTRTTNTINPPVPLPTSPKSPHSYQPSWIDGCGGKSVLPPMWDIAQDVLTDAWRVEPDSVEFALRTMVEGNKVVAEGAGACPVAAAMFGPVEEGWKKVVAVVCGGCIDTDVLMRILGGGEDYVPSLGFRFRGEMMLLREDEDVTATGDEEKGMEVLSSKRVRQLLPMDVCIQSAADANIALSNQTGVMPLRQVVTLPPSSSSSSKIGFLDSMPSYTPTYAACKSMSVYLHNKPPLSAHQGTVSLYDRREGNEGKVLLIADCHEITKIRTAAASAVATRCILGGGVHGCRSAKILSILGTGEQARSHIEAMASILPNLQVVRVWGRNREKAARVVEDVIEARWLGERVEVKTMVEDDEKEGGGVAACIDGADVICTVTSATVPILTKEHLPFLKPGCHINAVGACQPHMAEIGPEVFEHCFRR